MTDEYLFISDCHLDVNRPDITASLTDFLKNRAIKARFLYILGDLFEAWVGDDDPAPEYVDVLDQFKRLSRNTDIFFLCGNRDFLLHEAGADRIGATLLTEPVFLQLDGELVALLHGDSLCTDDIEYQNFRAMVRSVEWQNNFLSKSLAERIRIAQELRDQSQKAMLQKKHEIMDVNDNTVINCFAQYQADKIIHGHTHRPAIHNYDNNKTRIVLGDWNPHPSYLSWRKGRGFKLTDSRV